MGTNTAKAEIQHVWRYEVMIWWLWHVDLSVEKHQHAHWHAHTLKQRGLDVEVTDTWADLSHILTRFHPVRSLILTLLFSTYFSFFSPLLLLSHCPRSLPAPSEAMKEHMKAFAPTALHKYCTTQTCLANLHFFLCLTAPSTSNWVVSIHINKISGGTMCVFEKSFSSIWCTAWMCWTTEERVTALIALIWSIRAYQSAFYSMGDSSTGLFFSLTKLYINFKAIENDT